MCGPIVIAVSVLSGTFFFLVVVWFTENDNIVAAFSCCCCCCCHCYVSLFHFYSSFCERVMSIRFSVIGFTLMAHITNKLNVGGPTFVCVEYK